MHYFTEWWKQLFGESEGKDQKGIFPAGVDFTTDLHSMGQYIQEGRRNLFETVISIKTPDSDITINPDDDNLDAVKTYIHLKVKVVFDPPLNSTVMEAHKQMISELEWRLNVQVKEEV